MSTTDEVQEQDLVWFYEVNGERKGGVSENEIITLINNGAISYGTFVWKNGLPDWMKLENTELKIHLGNIPPPLTGDKVNNTIVWILAFAPVIGLFFEAFVAAIVYDGSDYLIDEAIYNAEFWYITVLLNIGLSILDSKRLTAAGHDMDKIETWTTFIVPVYLYRRAKFLKQSGAYFYVWLACFFLSFMGYL